MSAADVLYDIVVVGGGPAGLAAAASAARNDALRIALVDNGPALGGQIWRRGASSRPVAAARPWLERLERSSVESIASAEVVDAGHPAKHRWSLVLNTPHGARRLICRRLILATGATERFLPFPGWTLPGVVGAGGLQALIKSGLEVAGRRVVVAGSGPLLLAVAALARDRGARVELIAEQAPARSLARFGLGLWRRPSTITQGLGLRARLLGVPYRPSTWPVRALGDRRLDAVVLRGPRGDRTLECELLACGFGLVPETRLARWLGCAVVDGGVVVDAGQRTSVGRLLAAGELTGIGGVDAAVVEGRIAGYMASGQADRARSLLGRRRHGRRFASRLAEAFTLRDELRGLPTDETIVCRCEDVRWQAIRGHDDLRTCKLATRCGMGPCQ
ncbi:MAG: FAD-dependent oxidoreductase, partial [Acidobacteriota bacterium]